MTDGPFKDLRPVYWYNDTAPHCLKRNFFPAVPGHQEMLGWQYNEETVQGYTNLTTFEGFRSLEGGPHGVIHFVIGGADVGDMAPLTSPNGVSTFFIILNRYWNVRADFRQILCSSCITRKLIDCGGSGSK